MKHLLLSLIMLTGFGLAACSDAENPTASKSAGGLLGDWQSLDDVNYVLKFNTENYREFYENEEMSRDQWQAVNNCDDRQSVDKAAPSYGGFLIWTRETDDRICYVISDWTADSVSFTYAGTTSSYTRVN